MKVVTGFSAYRLLGNDFIFKTEFGTLNHTLVVAGTISPLLRNENMEEFAEDLPLENISNVFYRNAFDNTFYGPGWSEEDNSKCYQSKISSISIDENCTSVHDDAKVRERFDPHGGESIPVIDPYYHFTRSLWNSIGLEDLPQIKVGMNHDLTATIAHEETLYEILDHMESISCNFSADSLFKFLGRIDKRRNGSWQEATDVVVSLLSKLKLLQPGLVIVDGSGLSRLNRLTTSFLARLVYISSKEGEIFLRHLPSPGKGTLRNRLLEMRDLDIMAKTGSLAGVSSLTGYIERFKLSFSIIVNDSNNNEEEIRNVVDEILVDAIHRYEKVSE